MKSPARSPTEMEILKPNSWLVARLITFVETITPSCKDMGHLLSQSMDDRLPLRRRLAVRIHLTICNRCALIAKHLALLRQVSRLIVEHGERISAASLSDNGWFCVRNFRFLRRMTMDLLKVRRRTAVADYDIGARLGDLVCMRALAAEIYAR